jgi:hypothetical protein
MNPPNSAPNSAAVVAADRALPLLDGTNPVMGADHIGEDLI